MKQIIKLTEHVAKGQFAGFKKFVFGRVFYFGSSTPRREAERLAMNLMNGADLLKEAGLEHWTDEAIEQALGSTKLTCPAPVAAAVKESFEKLPKAPSPVMAGMTQFSNWTITQGIDAFLRHLDSRQVSQHTRWWAAESMRQLKAMLTLEADKHAADPAYNATVTPSTKLADIGFDELTWIVAKFRSRPISRKTSKPISIGTVRTIVGHCRDLFNYLADSGKWDECRRFERIFRIKSEQLMTATEKRKASAGAVSFTVEELATLYAHANDQQRLYMLLGLNAAFTQFDLATLTNFMIVNNGTAIERDRSKTSVKGFYQLWPMTKALLEERIEKTPANDQDLCLLTSEGKPLVWYKPNTKGQLRRVDSVIQTWSKLLKHKGVKGVVRPLSFKVLRKTGAQMLWNATNDGRIVQMHLSHASLMANEAGEVSGKKTVAESNYVNARQFQSLTDALVVLWSTLEPALKLAVKAAAAKKAKK